MGVEGSEREMPIKKHLVNRRWLSSVVLVAGGLCGLSLTHGAHAADAGASSSSEVSALETQLNQETTTLSTSDCDSACRALRSIRRAADRICALEPGPRCDAARAKADDATKRVHDACPDCAIPAPPSPHKDEAMTKGGSMSPPPPQNAPSEPQSERAGGCRSCTSAGSQEVDLGLLGLGILGVLRVIRKRRPNS